MRMPGRQRGAALFLILLLLLVGAGVVFVSRLKSADVELQAQRQTAAALAEAKQALLGRAAADPNHPGSLPCPDVSNPPSGIAPLMSGSNCPAYLGRLPWKTLGLSDPRDGAGESLWYALSPNFRDSSNVVNTTTTGTLSVSGSVSAAGVAAIVFAPGSPLAGQVRDTAHLNDYSAYLEGYASATATNFNTNPGAPINDQFLLIAPGDVMNVVTSRMAGELRLLLASPPYPMTLPPLPAWATANQWNAVMAYTASMMGTAATLGFSGCSASYTLQWDSGSGTTVISAHSGGC
jgi:hypothetical protein